MSAYVDHPHAARRDDLVITDDSYYGIVVRAYPEFVSVLCSNGICVNYPRPRVAWLPIRTVGEFHNAAHANFDELVAPANFAKLLGPVDDV